nr:hypothetical protein GCM10025732_57460 [Glycomyces mayteni]
MTHDGIMVSRRESRIEPSEGARAPAAVLVVDPADALGAGAFGVLGVVALGEPDGPVPQGVVGRAAVSGLAPLESREHVVDPFALLFLREGVRDHDDHAASFFIGRYGGTAPGRAPHFDGGCTLRAMNAH